MPPPPLSYILTTVFFVKLKEKSATVFTFSGLQMIARLQILPFLMQFLLAPNSNN